MINSEQINNKQNEEKLLKIQYAARVYFNLSEKINYAIWIVCIISALLVFLPDDITSYITIGIPIILDFVVLILQKIFSNTLQTAANLRNYFDSEVLEIDANQITQSEKQDLNTKAINIFQKKKDKARISIHNTGRDNPPGVRNWYEFKTELNGLEAQYECQCQNIWWNKNMIKNRLIIMPIVLFFITIFFILIFNALNASLVNIITCSIAIIYKIIERFDEHYKYHVISIKIDSIKDVIETQLNNANIEKLQSLINERRSLQVLEINWVHRKKSKKWSSNYENIN